MAGYAPKGGTNCQMAVLTRTRSLYPWKPTSYVWFGTKVLSLSSTYLMTIRSSTWCVLCVVLVGSISVLDCILFQIMEHHGTPWQISDSETPVNLTSPGSIAQSTDEDMTQTPGLTFASDRSDVSSSPDSASGPPTPVSPVAGLKLAPPPMIRRSSCDLFECIEQHQRLPEEQARYIFSQIVDAVYCLASMGICHRKWDTDTEQGAP